ncbi:MAG: sulfur reduction protein DsrS [Gammaproteobacteria bacterium]|nr:sulfur reduction protein DsrS [Gammaproteobacteria bacterium]
MALSNEDSLRLNVLLAQKTTAIRIDEGKMIVYALTQKGEAKIPLSPNVKNDKYIKIVKDFLSTKALGISGGFPMFLSSWNRMGGLRNSGLDKLLLLGEEEAVIAVVNNKDISAEIAKSAWWAMQSADNARSMLSNLVVVQADIGKDLAKFLIEFLPFEEDPLNMLISTRLVLQKGLISDDEVMALWKKAKSKNTLYVGFLDIRPDNLPETVIEHADAHQVQDVLAELVAHNNPYALALCKLSSSEGQTFLKTAQASFKRIPNYDIAGALLESIRRYIYINQPEAGQLLHHYEHALTLEGEPQVDIEALNVLVETLYNEQNDLSCSDELKAVQAFVPKLPNLSEHLKALLFLSRVSQTLLAPTIANSTAVGSLMRKKLKPIFDPILLHLRVLQN